MSDQLVDASQILASLKSDVKDIEKSEETSRGTPNLFHYIPKLLFSAIFCASALYVILSNKYPEETQKWAFGIIGVIVGVFIGSI
jgi:hypothetical protein